VSFSKVERGRVDYRKLQDFVSRPRFIELAPLSVQGAPAECGTAPAHPACALRCFSACGLKEWDAELPLEGTVQGTFTWAFIKALAASEFKCSVHQLWEAIVGITGGLKQHFKGVEQTPALALSQSAAASDAAFETAR